MGKAIAIIFFFLALAFPFFVFADMTSGRYTIYADAIGVSGEFSSSSSYALTDTLGEPPATTATSAVYTVKSGFQAMTRGSLSFVISTSSINLGILSTSTVNTATTQATVGSDEGGYILSINQVSGTMPAAVNDGAVTAGSEEYGLSVSGLNSVISGDVAVQGGRVLVSTTSPIMNDQSLLTFKASAAAGSVGGNYSQNVELIVSPAY